MNLTAMRTEVEEACRNRDLNRTMQVLAIAIPATKAMTDQPGCDELQESVAIAMIWAKTIGYKIEHIGKLMSAMMEESEMDGYPRVATATLFLNEVVATKKMVKWDSIDPNFYINVDYTYQMVKSYVDAAMEGEA